MSIQGWKAGRPGRKPWFHRLKDTWTNVRAEPPIPPSVEYDYHRRPLWGHYSNGFNVFGPYRRPILDAAGGGQLYARQLLPLAPNSIYAQAYTPVSLAGDGAELHGTFGVLPLVNVSQPQSEVISVSTVNGQTNITLANTTNPGAPNG